MRTKNAPPVVLALALCSGCLFPDRASVDPYDYAPLTSSSSWSPPKISEEAPLIPDEKTPLSLAEVIDIALRSNPNTKLTWANARIAAAEYGSSQAAYYPTLSGTYDWQRQRGLSGTGSTVSATVIPTNFFESQWGPQLQLSYTLLDFGQTSASAEAAKQALFQADYTHNRQIQTVIQQISADFYSLLYQKMQLAANEADLATAETTYSAARLGLDAGVKDISDLLQAQTQLLQARIALMTQKQNVVNAEATLLTDMGLGARQSIKIQEIPEIPPIEEMIGSADALLTLALQQRADLLAAEAFVKSQEANIDLALRQFLPTLTYNLTFGETSYTKLGSDGYDFLSAFSLNIPIFSGFSQVNSFKQAAAQKEQAEAELRQIELAIIQDVTIAHSNVKTTYENMQLADELLRAAQKEYDVALAKYKAGTGTVIELISAQSSLANARATEAQNMNNWFTALVQLSYAAGTLKAPQREGV